MKTFLIFGLALLTLPCVAQKEEIGVLGGVYLPQGGITSSSSGAVQGFFAHRLAKAPLVSLHLELPVTAGLNGSVFNSNLGVNTNYNALFITPGLKLKINAPVFPLVPYAFVGGGYARFSADGTTANKGAADYGVGLEGKILPHISLRLEAREFETANIGFPYQGLAGHNLFVLGGIGLKF